MIKSYLDEDGHPVMDDLPDDYDQAMSEAHDHWDNSSEGTLSDRYQTYHDMAIACNEEPISFDDWLNT